MAKKATNRLYNLNHTTLSKHRKNGYDNKYDFISYNEYWNDYETNDYDYENHDYENDYYYDNYYDDYSGICNYIMEEFKITGRMNYIYICGYPIRIVRI